MSLWDGFIYVNFPNALEVSSLSRAQCCMLFLPKPLRKKRGNVEAFWDYFTSCLQQALL